VSNVEMKKNLEDIIFFKKVLPHKVVLLLGNHDVYKKYDTDINSIIAFKHIENVTIYEKPIVLTNKQSSILVLPWVGNKDVEENKFNGIMLLSKKAPVSSREIEYRYLIEKKEYDIVASQLKLYDIIFISYNEPNADENFAKLLSRFPRAKRVHGVKGIHQAHIAAAKLATTPMFWVVDGDAVVEDDFKFDMLLPKHDTDIVHVWLSKNPINGLTYGYGGVKLLPKSLTENMDLNRCSLDMTMSISNKFKVMPTVSNITAFNTDPFNTWKSAFRECVKLASRPVDPRYQEETEDRLTAWCILGSDMPYGDYALSGAIAGRQFGIDNIAKPTELARINDFEWLLEQFQKPSPLS
jgi:hypothetical protein